MYEACFGALASHFLVGSKTYAAPSASAKKTENWEMLLQNLLKKGEKVKRASGAVATFWQNKRTDEGLSLPIEPVAHKQTPMLQR